MEGTAARLEATGDQNRPGGAGVLQQNVIEVIWKVLSGETHLNCGGSSIQTMKKYQAAALSRPSKRLS